MDLEPDVSGDLVWVELGLTDAALEQEMASRFAEDLGPACVVGDDAEPATKLRRGTAPDGVVYLELSWAGSTRRTGWDGSRAEAIGWASTCARVQADELKREN